MSSMQTSVLNTNGSLWIGGQSNKRNQDTKEASGDMGAVLQRNKVVSIYLQPPCERQEGVVVKYKPVAVFFCCKEGGKHLCLTLLPSIKYLKPRQD